MKVDGEGAEAVADVLQRYSHQGVSLEHDGIPPDKWDETEIPPPQYLILRAYFPDDEKFLTTREQIEAALGHMRLLYPVPVTAYRSLDADDWADAWKAHYQPVRVGRRLLIRPQWIELQKGADDIEIAMDPGMAFGTGTHPTTQLCLEALEAHIIPGYDVLDLGSGSGILSIAAAKLGANRVLALDIDVIAVEATRDNAHVNGVADKVVAENGSLETVLTSARRFDLLVVNILARVILEMTDQRLGDLVRPGGTALFSGIIDTQVDEVEAGLRRTGLHPKTRRQSGDWVLVVATRPGDP